jgi:hypothetical protein
MLVPQFSTTCCSIWFEERRAETFSKGFPVTKDHEMAIDEGKYNTGGEIVRNNNRSLDVNRGRL